LRSGIWWTAVILHSDFCTIFISGTNTKVRHFLFMIYPMERLVERQSVSKALASR
jgi:hypothetical protein